VKGWREGTADVAPFTVLAGAFERHTGRDPFALPESWLSARGRLDLATPFDFVTTNDIIGGNSGSPVVNRDAEIVGLVFDGNIHSLGGEYGFDAAVNRTVAVDSRAIVEALAKIYGARRIVDELRPGAGKPPPRR
jgi:S1-C subfamily serine protease